MRPTPVPRAPCARATRPMRPCHAPCRWCSGCIAIQPCPCPLLPGHNTPKCIAIQIVPSQVSCNTILQYTSLQPAFLSHNTLGVLRYSLSQPHALSSLQYNNCIAILSSQPPSLAIHSCNTILASLGHITIQILLTQYDLGNSHPNFRCIFFSLLLLFSFPATGKLQKNIYIPFFFHFPKHSNKFIKILFYSSHTQINL